MFVRDSGIELRIRSYVADVGVAAAQTAAVEHVGAESGAVPEVGDARGAGRNLGVIRVDVVTLDVLELRRASRSASGVVLSNKYWFDTTSVAFCWAAAMLP